MRWLKRQPGFSLWSHVYLRHYSKAVQHFTDARLWLLTVPIAVQRLKFCFYAVLFSNRTHEKFEQHLQLSQQS